MEYIGHGTTRYPHRCEVCLYSGKSRGKLIIHYYANHLDLKHWKCDSCDYVGESETALKSHSRKHKEYKHKCDKCFFTTFAIPLLTQHTKYRHDKNEVSCNICMASCRNEMAPLRHHMKAHLGYKKKYRCSKCDLRVISKQHLKTHIRSVHEKLKDYKCSHCNFATTQPQHLQLHIKSVRLKIKDQKCPYCDFTSTQRSHVKTHIQLLHEVFILEKRITYVLNAVMQHIK